MSWFLVINGLLIICVSGVTIKVNNVQRSSEDVQLMALAMRKVMRLAEIICGTVIIVLGMMLYCAKESIRLF